MAANNRADKHDLKPCPFCGSTDLTVDNLGQRNDWFVNCNICEIQQIANYTEAQAVALWNKRADGIAGEVSDISFKPTLEDMDALRADYRATCGEGLPVTVHVAPAVLYIGWTNKQHDPKKPGSQPGRCIAFNLNHQARQ